MIAARQLRSLSPPSHWPLARYSKTVACEGVNWHVQQLGEGPSVLLLHGTGASTHSWRALANILSAEYHVVMCDLPGHGFTSRPDNSRMSLAGMTDLIDRLLNKLNVIPEVVIGHSAGAAICCQLVLNSCVKPRCIASINGALLPLPGVAGQVFVPIAQLLSVNPLVPKLVSWRAKSSALTARLLNDTGSQIDAEGRDYYAQLLRNPVHVSGALRMMAHWNLDNFIQRLAHLSVPLHLIVGANDKTVSPSQGGRVKRRVASATLTQLPSLGHLAHEEAPEVVASVLRPLFIKNNEQEKFPNIVTTDDQRGVKI